MKLRIPPSERIQNTPSLAPSLKDELKDEEQELGWIYRRGTRDPGDAEEIADQMQQLAISLGLPHHRHFASWVDWGRPTWATAASASNTTDLTLLTSTRRALYEGTVPQQSSPRSKLHRRAMYTVLHYEDSLFVPVPLDVNAGFTSYNWVHAYGLYNFFRSEKPLSGKVEWSFDKQYARITQEVFATFVGSARATLTRKFKELRELSDSESSESSGILEVSFAHQRRMAIAEWARTSIWTWVLATREEKEWIGRNEQWPSIEQRKCAALQYVSNMLTPLILIMVGKGTKVMQEREAIVLSPNAWNGKPGKTKLVKIADDILQYASDNDWATQGDVNPDDIPPGASIEDLKHWKSFVLADSESVPISYQRDPAFNAIIDLMRSVVAVHGNREIHIPPLANHERVLEFMEFFEDERWPERSCTTFCGS